MKLLAFDTSTEFLSLAVQNAGELFTYSVLAGQMHSQIILMQAFFCKLVPKAALVCERCLSPAESLFLHNRAETSFGSRFRPLSLGP